MPSFREIPSGEMLESQGSVSTIFGCRVSLPEPANRTKPPSDGHG